MMTRNLHCAPNTIAGPVDERVVSNLRRRHRIDDDFVAQMAECQGGVPQIAAFSVNGSERRVGQFLTLLDEESVLVPPERPHFDQPMDERVAIGIPFVLSYDHSTSRALFSGLVPFAALGVDMCLDRAYVDLLCLDFRRCESSPPVVLWDAAHANDAYIDWDFLPFDEKFDEDDNYLSVPWEKFVVRVSDTFADFIGSLT